MKTRMCVMVMMAVMAGCSGMKREQLPDTWQSGAADYQTIPEQPLPPKETRVTQIVIGENIFDSTGAVTPTPRLKNLKKLITQHATMVSVWVGATGAGPDRGMEAARTFSVSLRDFLGSKNFPTCRIAVVQAVQPTESGVSEGRYLAALHVFWKRPEDITNRCESITADEFVQRSVIEALRHRTLR